MLIAPKQVRFVKCLNAYPLKHSQLTVNQLRLVNALYSCWLVNQWLYAAVATCVANAANSSFAALGSADQPTVIAIA